MKVLTWNPLDYGRWRSGAEIARCSKVPEIIASERPDLVCIQEIMCDEAGYVELAWQTGLECHIPVSGSEPVVALAPGRDRRGVGLMWNPGTMTPVPDSRHTFEKTPMTQGMVVADFTVGGKSLTAASTHFTARCGPNVRYTEAVIATRWLYSANENALVGADWNCVSAARRRHGYPYDHDPFADLPWREDFISSCRWDDLGHWADRTPMEVMERGGLHDLTAELGGPWQRTVGYWKPTSIEKRIDGVRATRAVVKAARSSRTIDTEETRSVSDHLPVVYEIDESALADAVSGSELP